VIAVVDQPTVAAAAHLSSQRLRAAGRQRAQGPRHAGGGLRILPQKRGPEATDDGADSQFGRGVGVGKLSRGLTTRCRPVVVTWV
jgi:hypothetical protein